MDIKTANKILANHAETARQPSYKDMRALLENEYKMTVQVYGNRVDSYPPHTARAQDETLKLARRLHIIQAIATTLKNFYNDNQTILEL